MSSSLWTKVARAGFAGLRPMTMFLVPSLRHSLLRSGPILGLSARRNYALEATARVPRPAVSTPAPVVEQDDDMSDDQPLFSSLQGKVHPNTLKAIVEKPFNYVHMSSVQAEILPLLPGLAQARAENPESTDLLVKARTGTGKTLAFLVPAIEARLKQIAAVDSDPKVQRQYAMDNVGTLIISPTRELATQIVQEAQKLTSHHRGMQTSVMVGGLDKHRQLNDFMRNSKDILVATPGRLRDMLSNPRVAATLKNTKMLILDEADTLLDMGFRDDIEDIMTYLPNKSVRQTLLFSATVSPSIKQIADAHLADNHKFVNCVSEDTSEVHDHIPQYHTVLPEPKDQLPHILRLIFQDQLEHGDKSKVIVFLNTTKMTQLAASMLYELSSSAFPMPRTYTFEIHSKKTMGGRTTASNGFRRSQRASILVTSDVSARGVDYPGVTRVIQVGLPAKPEQYVHRVGRTGRGGSLVGRGDLVVSAWEHEWVKRNLSHIPLKPLTVKDFANEVAESLQPKEGARPNSSLVRYQDLERTTTEVLSRLDEAAVGETMTSMLGFYAGMSGQLRVSMQDLLENLQRWTTDGMGLKEPPYVSPAFLQKIGMGRQSRSFGGNRQGHSAAKSFGQKREWRDSDGSEGFRRSSGPGYMRDGGADRKPWEHRGSSRPSFGGDRPPRREFNGERPPRREFDGDSRPPRRDFGDRPPRFEGGERPRYSSGRERPEGFQSRRTRSFESKSGGEAF
ncbi:RNA helicase [Coprinopsis sp. MPI-PUGE-AT-0042]|nr:RNA helicase [Coprinopsis sp. MPI-PUGE-AT-0042]